MVHHQNCIIFVVIDITDNYKPEIVRAASKIYVFSVKFSVFSKSFEQALIEVYSDFLKQIMIA